MLKTSMLPVEKSIMHHHVCRKGKLCKSDFSNGRVGCAQLQPLHCLKPSIPTIGPAAGCCAAVGRPCRPQPPASAGLSRSRVATVAYSEAMWIRLKKARGKKHDIITMVAGRKGFCGACFLPVRGSCGRPFLLLFKMVRGSRNRRRIMSLSCLQQRCVDHYFVRKKRVLGGCFPPTAGCFKAIRANNKMKYHGCSDDLFATGGGLRLPNPPLLFSSCLCLR